MGPTMAKLLKSGAAEDHGIELPSEGKPSDLALTVRRLRQDKNLRMHMLAQRSGLGVSTISKIESGQISPTYDTLLRIAGGLDVDVAELFSSRGINAVTGRRAVTRRNAGVVHETPQYVYEMLCSELSNKKFIPLVTRVSAHSLSAFPKLIQHAGEEFVYVLSGRIVLHTEHYAPTVLEEGDSAYFDSQMGHCCVSAGDEDAVLLWICSTVQPPLTSTVSTPPSDGS
jgi:transcriptional regulator with XRE-family HTH domain